MISDYDPLYRRLMLQQDGFRCPVCGVVMTRPQRAHFLGQGKRSRKMWGNAIIDHPLNSIMVCSLKCNNAIQLNPGARPEECRQHAEYIKKKIEEEKDAKDSSS